MINNILMIHNLDNVQKVKQFSRCQLSFFQLISTDLSNSRLYYTLILVWYRKSALLCDKCNTTVIFTSLPRKISKDIVNEPRYLTFRFLSNFAVARLNSLSCSRSRWNGISIDNNQIKISLQICLDFKLGERRLRTFYDATKVALHGN